MPHLIWPSCHTKPGIAFDRCQWQWCEITSGFESNPILASSLNGTPWPLHRKLLFSLLEGYCHGELLDSISWRTINSGNCWCLQIPRAECFHSLAYTNNNREWWVGELQTRSDRERSGQRERSGGTRSEWAVRSRRRRQRRVWHRRSARIELAPVLDRGLRYLARRPVSTRRGSTVPDWSFWYGFTIEHE